MKRVKDTAARELEEVLLCASDLVRTERAGLSEACERTYGWELYWPCRNVLEYLEIQLGYEIWTKWGDAPDDRRPTSMTYADALLECAGLVHDHYRELADHLVMESETIRQLRREVRHLKELVSDMMERVPNVTTEAMRDLYTGVFR